LRYLFPSYAAIEKPVTQFAGILHPLDFRAVKEGRNGLQDKKLRGGNTTIVIFKVGRR